MIRQLAASKAGLTFPGGNRSKATQAFIKSALFLSLARGLPRQVKGAGLRTLSRRGSWVQIPPPAPICWYSLKSEDSYLVAEGRFSRKSLAFLRTSLARLFCQLLCFRRILNLG